MKWTNDLPTKAGYYLRNKPFISTQDGTMKFLEDWHGAKYMWWFGPIPDPPRVAPER